MVGAISVTRPPAREASVCLVVRNLGAEDTMIMSSIAWQNKTISNTYLNDKEKDQLVDSFMESSDEEKFKWLICAVIGIKEVPGSTVRL